MRMWICILTMCLLATGAQATKPVATTGIDAFVEARAESLSDLAGQIWEWAELGYKEQRSSALLQTSLQEAGFRLQTGVAGIPTAFIAEYGQGKPVIALLAEFDALPGMSQTASPHRTPRAEDAPGHACGHHLFGAGSVGAALAVADWLKRTGMQGTIRLYGTPAEEGGSGKVYMVRAGLFDDADLALHWHPRDRNAAWAATTLANKSAKFRFHGISTHAAAAPERGRSALDGVEAMNHMVNLLREHVPQETRIHYVITHGGAAPNIVPDFAEVFYYVRHPQVARLQKIWARVEAAAEGAAMGTGTQVEHEVIHGNYNVLPNETLARLMHEHLLQVGGVTYDEAEMAFAESLRATLGDVDLDLTSATQIQPYRLDHGKASTDVGDVSWALPTTGLVTATWVPGTAAHSWQAVACGGTSIGHKGMLVATRTLAHAVVSIFQNPAVIVTAREEWARRRGADFDYKPLLGDRQPPLDYRD
ncbi:MAG: amidohydrolase [Gemmatimonadetes bacterium]|jgi:aminobenzoyl-glutamate utilization protein B|nr:amidohydrolase [Gemmatimonadota bacterium]MBT7863632.1 amidohydrolase [Gemmatimonadota bacterium]